MKKLPFFFSVILLSLYSITVQAQFIKSIGIRTGWCSTNPNVRESRNGIPSQEKIYNMNFFYNEIQVEYLQKGRFSLLTNFSYIPKGYSYYSPPSGSLGFLTGFIPGSIERRNADYINIMTASKFSYKIGPLNLYGFTGLFIGILGPYNDYYNNVIYLDSPNIYNPNYEEEKVLTPITWGGTICGGIETNRINKRINYSLQTQFMHDFSIAADYKRAFYFNDREHEYQFKMKYQTFLLSFSIHYSFKKKD